jgi:hypothetical protein
VRSSVAEVDIEGSLSFSIEHGVTEGFLCACSKTVTARWFGIDTSMGQVPTNAYDRAGAKEFFLSEKTRPITIRAKAQE